jgi:hypothetical protein
VLIYDYTGYGLNKGVPSEKNCYDDIWSAYVYLVEEQGVAPEKIILYSFDLSIWCIGMEKLLELAPPSTLLL